MIVAVLAFLGGALTITARVCRPRRTSPTSGAGARIVFRFPARDLHLALGPKDVARPTPPAITPSRSNSSTRVHAYSFTFG
jgi:hypothetical protein